MKVKSKKADLTPTARRFLKAAARMAHLETDRFDTRAVAKRIGIVNYLGLRNRLAATRLLAKGKSSSSDRLTDKGWSLLYQMTASDSGVTTAALDAAVASEADRLLARNPTLLRSSRKRSRLEK